MMKLLFCFTFAALVFVSSAQWTVVHLHPNGASDSEITDVQDDQQVGRATVSTVNKAALWTGFSNTYIDLHPAGFPSSVAWGVGGGKQVGKASTGAAGMWSGSSGSWTSLLPAGSTSADCYGTDGVQQVGYANFPGSHRASLWSGTSASWVDLSPVGTTYSDAFDVSNAQQVGSVNINGLPHASLWSGAAGSWVDMHPGGVYFRSGARSLHGSSQVGNATTTGNVTEAGLWTGSAASFVSLHPAGASSSTAEGVYQTMQVGSAVFGGPRHAGLWRGTSATWENLHIYLPIRFSESEATCIWRSAGITYIGGYAFDPSLNRREAVMWVSGTQVLPTSYSHLRGIPAGGNLASLLASDDDKLLYRPGVVLGSGQAPVQVVIDSTAPTSNPVGFTFEVESSANFGNAEQKIALYNFVTNQYEVLDMRSATIADRTTKVTVTSNISRFIQPGTNAIRGLVSFRATGPSLAFPWLSRIDMAAWRFP